MFAHVLVHSENTAHYSNEKMLIIKKGIKAPAMRGLIKNK